MSTHLGLHIEADTHFVASAYQSSQTLFAQVSLLVAGNSHVSLVSENEPTTLRRLAMALMNAADQADALAGVTPDPEPHEAMARESLTQLQAGTR